MSDLFRQRTPTILPYHSGASCPLYVKLSDTSQRKALLSWFMRQLRLHKSVKILIINLFLIVCYFRVYYFSLFTWNVISFSFSSSVISYHLFFYQIFSFSCSLIPSPFLLCNVHPFTLFICNRFLFQFLTNTRIYFFLPFPSVI